MRNVNNNKIGPFDEEFNIFFSNVISIICEDGIKPVSESIGIWHAKCVIETFCRSVFSTYSKNEMESSRQHEQRVH